MNRLKNPMRFSLRNRTIEYPYDVNVTELEVRTDEGQLYVHWEPPICETCLAKCDTMYRWTPGGEVHWLCEDDLPASADDVEEYTV